jgi:hypothetical protein
MAIREYTGQSPKRSRMSRSIGSAAGRFWGCYGVAAPRKRDQAVDM